MRALHHAALGLFLATVAVQGTAAQTNVREKFTAVLTNISNVGGTGLTPVDLRITRWTPDEENERLLEVLRSKGQDAFLRALVDVKPVGSIATPTSLSYDIFYARETPRDGGRRLMLITDRPMSFAERFSASRSRDYPFTVIQLDLDSEGNGQGTLAQAAQLRLLGNILGIENLATSTMKLSEVKKVVKK